MTKSIVSLLLLAVTVNAIDLQSQLRLKEQATLLHTATWDQCEDTDYDCRAIAFLRGMNKGEKGLSAITMTHTDAFCKSMPETEYHQRCIDQYRMLFNKNVDDNCDGSLNQKELAYFFKNMETLFTPDTKQVPCPATPARGLAWCKSPTTKEAGNCCADYDMNLDEIRNLPNLEGVSDRRPVCHYEGGVQIGTVETQRRGEVLCKSPTTNEEGNCCASGHMNLDAVRSIPDFKAHGAERPICYYEGGAEVGEVDQFEKWRVNFTPAQCYSQGVCNQGYMDSTSGKSNYWGCAAKCPGGKYRSRGDCYCACVEMPDDCK